MNVVFVEPSFPPTRRHFAPALYMANAYVRMRHPGYDVLLGMLDDVGRTIHVHAGLDPRARLPQPRPRAG